jgi:hypothetical protein
MCDEQPKRKLRFRRSKNKLTKEFIEECKALRERIRAERGGELVPDSTEIIRHTRDDDPDGFWCRD